MKKINLVLLMAGSSQRANLLCNKVLYQINHKPVFCYSLEKMIQLTKETSFKVNKIILVVNKDITNEVEDIINQYNGDITIIEGGLTRAQSVRNAVEISTDVDAVVIHDAARPLTDYNDFKKLILNTNKVGTLYHKVTDTIKQYDMVTTTLDRNSLYAVSTPQYFDKELFNTILNPIIDDEYITDDTMLFEETYQIEYHLESNNNMKITTKDDIDYINYYLTHQKEYKIGHSFDFHPFSENRKLILGGVTIESPFGLAGHSDADVVYHSVAESIIGALQYGDLGTHYPDTDNKYLNIDSSIFVKDMKKKLEEENYKIVNIDIIIYLEKPNLKNYKKLMVKNLQEILQCEYINVKATTLEKQGLIGTNQGIGVETVVLIQKL